MTKEEKMTEEQKAIEWASFELRRMLKRGTEEGWEAEEYSLKVDSIMMEFFKAIGIEY
jgi:hypothetical protein